MPRISIFPSFTSSFNIYLVLGPFNPNDYPYQEKYLRVFLEDAQIPLDNNDAERSIKKFCVAKKNWQIIASMNGARASALLYSIAESAKANGLKPYE